MTSRRSFLPPVFLALLVLAGRPAAAQASHPRRGQDPALQKQLADLQEGQRRILEELEAIKAGLAGQAQAGEHAATPKPDAVVSVNLTGEPFRGAGTARVAILEYSDFDCPFCAKYANGIFRQINDAYLRTGKVKYYFRDLPLPEHPNAAFKAQAARCAGDQGKFWEAHDLLFSDQRPLEGARLEAFIHELGLDAATFKASLDSGKFAEAIRQSARSADRLEIRGTPAFLIGALSPDGHVLRVSRVLLGAPGFGSFQEILDPLLTDQAAPAAAPQAQKPASGGSTCG